MSSPSVQQDRISDHETKRLFVQRVIDSPMLHGSEALCHLLRYLAGHALESPHVPIKEYQIATEVFGRSQNFDPRIDSTVRVQTSRLRAKLAEYYASVGSTDSWQIEIPKGSYSLIFHEGSASKQIAIEPPAAISPTRRGPSSWLWAITVAAVLIAAVTLVQSERNAPAAAATAGISLREFWHAALPHSEAPLVVFSNAEFVGRPETGLRYRRPNQDSSEKVFDQYTGVGEVIAIHELDELFDRIDRKFSLKRGRLMNWDDAKNRDLIFVGSPSENLALREIPLNRNFSFEISTAAPRHGDLGIRNLKPQPGEQEWYFGSTQEQVPMTEDYALVELAAGAVSSQRMLLVAGTTTFGTQGAVEFVCREDKVASLLARLGKADSQRIGRLSALLRVRIQRGVPVDSEIVAFRKD
jgi:hypothetical protein